MKRLLLSHDCQNSYSHPRVFSLDQVASPRSIRSQRIDQFRHTWHHLVSACGPSHILPFLRAQASGAPAFSKKTTPSNSQARVILLSGMTLHRDNRISKTNRPSFHPAGTRPFQAPCRTGTTGPATTIFHISSSKVLNTLHRITMDLLPLATTVCHRDSLRFPRLASTRRARNLLPRA
jgi:hypothetical protein